MSNNEAVVRCNLHVGGCPEEHQKYLDVLRTFGSKRAKRKAEDLQNLTIDPTFVGDQPELQPPNPSSSSSSGSYIIPKRNMEARRLEDVYDVEKIVSERVLNAFVVNGSLSNNVNTQSTFVRRHVRLAERKNDARRARLCLYIGFMMASFCNVDTELAKAPSLVFDEIRDRYRFQHRGGQRTKKELYDLMLLDMFVICLLVSDNRVSVNELAADIDQPAKSVRRLFKALGCRFKNGIASLRFPVLKEPIGKKVPIHGLWRSSPRR